MEPVTQNPEVPQNITPKSSMPKWPFFIIALLLILLFAFGGYIFLNKTSKEEAVETPEPTISITQTPSTPSPTTLDETADWKTYSNETSKYQVKYPTDKYVRLICPGEELVLRTRATSDTKDEETFETCGRDGRFTIEVVTAASLTEPKEDEFMAVTKEDITVAGVNARKYITTRKPAAEGPIPDYSEDIYFTLGGKNHLVHFDKIVSEDIKDNFLSSFKLL